MILKDQVNIFPNGAPHHGLNLDFRKRKASQNFSRPTPIREAERKREGDGKGKEGGREEEEM